MKDIKKYSFWVGAGIVALTHLYMLWMGLTSNMMTAHAITNLIALGLIIYGRK